MPAFVALRWDALLAAQVKARVITTELINQAAATQIHTQACHRTNKEAQHPLDTWIGRQESEIWREANEVCCLIDDALSAHATKNAGCTLTTGMVSRSLGRASRDNKNVRLGLRKMKDES